MRRADEKQTLQTHQDQLASPPPLSLSASVVDPADIALHTVTARGEYVDRYTILLDNKVHRGRVGYYVISPLRISGGSVHVLVNRGWIAAGRTRDELPVVAAPAGERTIEGIAIVPSKRFYELEPEAPEGRVWQNLALERYRAWSKLALQPVVIQQTNDLDDGLVREWDRPDMGVDRHRSYALQWFSLATLSVVLYVALNFKRHAGGRG